VTEFHLAACIRSQLTAQCSLAAAVRILLYNKCDGMRGFEVSPGLMYVSRHLFSDITRAQLSRHLTSTWCTLSAKLHYTDTGYEHVVQYTTTNGRASSQQLYNKFATSQCQSPTSRHVKMLGCGKLLSVGGEFVVQRVVELLWARPWSSPLTRSTRGSAHAVNARGALTARTHRVTCVS